MRVENVPVECMVLTAEGTHSVRTTAVYMARFPATVRPRPVQSAGCPSWLPPALRRGLSSGYERTQTKVQMEETKEPPPPPPPSPHSLQELLLLSCHHARFAGGERRFVAGCSQAEETRRYEKGDRKEKGRKEEMVEAALLSSTHWSRTR